MYEEYLKTSPGEKADDLFRTCLFLSGYNTKDAIYLYKNESLDDLLHISKTFGDEMVKYRASSGF